jgi:polysaccharide export outer membrane protein
MNKHEIVCTVCLLLVLVIPVKAQQQTQPAAADKSTSTPASAPAQSQTQLPAPNKQQPEPSPANKPSAPIAAEATKGQTPPATTGKPTRGGGAARATKLDSPPVVTEYLIGNQDVLVVDVWQEKEFSAKATVRPDGKITLPLLNDIQAAGVTPTQLAESIRKSLEKYVTDPRVTIIVEQINSRVVYMSGEVTHPGALPLTRDMTVLQALSMVGGPNQYGNPKKIYIMRTVNGKTVKFPFNYKLAIKNGPGKDNIYLQPGDTVVVP